MCHKHFFFLVAPPATPELNLTPGKTVSLQCVLLTYVKLGHCGARLRRVSLTWVDEAGAEIQEDSQHRIKKGSSCDVTLTVTFQSPGNKKFRCQATVDEQVQTSVELSLRVLGLYGLSLTGRPLGGECKELMIINTILFVAPKGRGRGLIVELEHEDQGTVLFLEPG